MCLIALLYRVVKDAPVIVGANREEFYARGGEPPRLHPDPTPWVGGFDPLGGGTWLGVNAHGLLVAVTNRFKTDVPIPRRSRGTLVRELLRHKDAAAATEEATQRLQTEPYDGCNLLVVGAAQATVLQAGDGLRVQPLPPGLHVIANRDLNDEADDRVQHVLHWLSARRYFSPADGLHALQEVCAQHEPEHPPISLHLETRGTVSSSLLVLRGDPVDLGASTYLHSQGPPDRTPYTDRSDLVRQLGS
jgi:uncharacterized protein with NRDE domain